MSCYCEENAYHLIDALSCVGGVRVRVGFISNSNKSVLLFHQQASQYSHPFPVLWDYHVIAVVEAHDSEYIIDLDTKLDRVSNARDYLNLTFSPHTPHQYRAFINLTPAHSFLQSFASDRRHMLTNKGTYSSPPPPWKCIRGHLASLPHNLDIWIEGANEDSERISPLYE
ncbi:Protein glutamine amidohydrolase [Wallemia ichthyophaga EXF-994]|uniref:Protein N-terminal glutamine amidohydrolase n=1 Tax=Wallemia ichthyophaga (strain EXF-994 / CBS 113033) TaxID=1299270 RepID=R9AAK5_WALI9|nr:Protein glutamine amidohydrolase [Wallemia ichthyophaga EXF-994]EOQ99089.1 Protein glutamine amidohydrolase [Wallemia ichthyophaga EXF-994]